MKKFVIALLLSVSSLSSNAAYVENLEIERVQVTPSGGFLLFLNQEVHANCVTSGKDVVYVYPNQGNVTGEGIKSLLSIALVGFTSNKKVALHFDENSNECWVQYITLDK